MEILGEPVISVCLECGGRNIIQDLESGEMVCGGCGLVIAEPTVNTEPEWRAFTKSEYETRSRVGLPSSFSIHDKGLSTMIGPVYNDGHGRRIPQEARLRMLRLRRWQTRSIVNGSEERNLAQAMSELDRLTERLHSPRAVKEQAAVIYRRALKEGFIRGRSISSMVAASLYVALRVHQGCPALPLTDVYAYVSHLLRLLAGFGLHTLIRSLWTTSLAARVRPVTYSVAWTMFSGGLASQEYYGNIFHKVTYIELNPCGCKVNPLLRIFK